MQGVHTTTTTTTNNNNNNNNNNNIKKSTVIPLQAWIGPEGSRRLRFPDFKTIST